MVKYAGPGRSSFACAGIGEAKQDQHERNQHRWIMKNFHCEMKNFQQVDD
jgi:hypothetical protein